LKTLPVHIGLLKRNELEEADRIFRTAFGSFLGLPNPLDFMGDRELIKPRWRAKHSVVIAARDKGRLIGSNVVTRWGAFGFFGPLTVLPEYWDQGVGQQLLKRTTKIFDAWKLRHTGLFTFPQSAKHVGLYQKFGYWPRYLTAVMAHTPSANPTQTARGDAAALLSTLTKAARDSAIQACRNLTGKIDKGLDLSGEIEAVLAHRTGDVVLTHTRGALDAFAVCLHGPGSEGGQTTCYIKFGAARGGPGAGERFSRLLIACDEFASMRGLSIEAGVNLAREEAYRRMRAHGYRTVLQGVAMQKPHGDGFNRAGAYVIDDWR
jgi:GNAT superfamily N-acetyltransferase